MVEECKGLCSEHSGMVTGIANLKEETVKQGTSIERIEGKLNMILGAMVLSPFLWTLLTGFLKVKG